MLKWSVNRIPSSSALSSCSDTTPSVTCCSSTFRLQPASPFKAKSRSCLYVTTRENKENRAPCKQLLEDNRLDYSFAVDKLNANRDSVYMHLDNLPVALRDVSNNLSPLKCSDQPTNKDFRKKIQCKRKSARLKKSPCRSKTHQHYRRSSDLHQHISPACSTPKPNSVVRSLEAEERICVKSEKENSDNRPMMIGHSSSEPIRSLPTIDQSAGDATKSESHSSPILLDNPLYFTIQTSPPEEPEMLFHKSLPDPVSRKSAPRASVIPPAAMLTIKRNSRISDVSPLARKLAWLRLNSMRTNVGSANDSLASESPQIADRSKCPETSVNSSAKEDDERTVSNNDDDDDNGDNDGNRKKKRKLRKVKRRSCRVYDDLVNGDRPLAASCPNERSESPAKNSLLKRRCVVFSEDTFPLNTPPAPAPSDKSQRSKDDGSSGTTESLDLDAPSTLKRQRVIRKPRNLTKTERMFKSCLTLPDGIPSPANAAKGKFQIFSPIVSVEQQHRLDKSNLIDDATGSHATIDNDNSASSTGKRKECSSPLEEETLLSVATWNSHENRVLPVNTENPNGRLQPEEHSVTPISSKHDYFESPQAVNDINGDSLLAVTENNFKLNTYHFSTPKTSSTPHKKKIKRRNLSSSQSYSPEKGQIDLQAYFENSNIVIHVKKARNLQIPVGDLSCNAYVKINLIPPEPSQTFHRTSVRRDSCNPNFDYKFSIKVNEDDHFRRILISVWHRNRAKRKSEFLGCVSFPVKDVIKKEVNGTYKLLQHSSGIKSQQHSTSHSCQLVCSGGDLMASHLVNSFEDRFYINETDKINNSELTTENEKKKTMTITKKEVDRGGKDEYLFLQHLELDPVSTIASENDNKRGGKTPFTTTYKLLKQPNGSFGFSVAWTHPPRVERVEANLPADSSGLRPGDNIVFVNKTNVVALPEEEIMEIIKECGTKLVLEIYRKPITSSACSYSQMMTKSVSNCANPNDFQSALCRAPSTDVNSVYASGIAADASKRQLLQLPTPQITFTSENRTETDEWMKHQAVYQLLQNEQQYALCLQFGISRFLLPLAERRDLLKPNEHTLIFQNFQELLRITEDILEQLIQEDGSMLASSIWRIYLKRIPSISAAYRRYCCGLKKADCILVEKTRNSEFMRLVMEPPIPKKRPDLITFVHKPLEHFRDVLIILKTISSCKTGCSDQDNRSFAKLVNELQMIYKDITIESGLMEPGTDGRPLVSLQDLESRLVFTKCRPFVLNVPGRKWIFGSDLSRVEGRSVRLFWALLFSDILLFTKINRDKVVFVTEEPLPLINIIDAQFNVKKKASEFRLIIGTNWRNPAVNSTGNDSPAQAGCVPHFHSPLSKTPNNKDIRRRTIIFRAPSQELKAVWQNLIQRQLIKINTTGQPITPLMSPIESANQFPVMPFTESVLTVETTSTANKSQQTDDHINDLIDFKCRQLGKCTSKGRAYHLCQWMKGQLDNTNILSQPESEADVEIWSEEDLKLRTAQLDINYMTESQNEMDVVYFNLSKSSSMSSLMTPPEEVPEVSVCQKCHKTCLRSPQSECKNLTITADAFLDNQNSISAAELASYTLLSPTDPFSPIPDISVTPPDSPPYTEQDDTACRRRYQENEKSSFDSSSEDSTNKTCNEEKSTHSSRRTRLKKYASFTNLNVLSDDIYVQKTSDDEGVAGADNLRNGDEYTESWTSRASSFVAQKVALFEKFGENINASNFLERCLRLTSADGHESIQRTIAFEEEEASGGTSGDEFWGTPNSGGGVSIASNECAALSPSSVEADDDEYSQRARENEEQNLVEEIILNKQTIVSQHSITPNRMLANRPRLEPLPEDEEELEATSTTSASLQSPTSSSSECTVSCPMLQQNNSTNDSVCNENDIVGRRSIFKRFKLHRAQSAEETDSRIRRRGNKSELTRTGQERKEKKFLKIFRRSASDDASSSRTTSPQETEQETALLQKQDDDHMEKSLWTYIKSKGKAK